MCRQSVLKKGRLVVSVERYNQRKLSLYILWALGVLALGALLTVIRFNKEWVMTSRFVERYHQLKLDLKAALLFLSAALF